MRPGVPVESRTIFARTAVRTLVRAGAPERVAMQLTGHKTRSVFERYNSVSDGDLRDAAARLDLARDHKSDHTVGSRSSDFLSRSGGAARI